MAYFIEFIDVSISFDDRKVLDGVSFGVEEGETFAILGPSGVGKTVTLTLAVGLLKPDKGRIIIDGEDITQMSERELAHVRRKVQLVFQSGALFDSLVVPWIVSSQHFSNRWTAVPGMLIGQFQNSIHNGLIVALTLVVILRSVNV